MFQLKIRELNEIINPNVKNGIMAFLPFVLNIKDKGRSKRAIIISEISGMKYLMLRIFSIDYFIIVTPIVTMSTNFSTLCVMIFKIRLG